MNLAPLHTPRPRAPAAPRVAWRGLARATGIPAFVLERVGVEASASAEVAIATVQARVGELAWSDAAKARSDAAREVVLLAALGAPPPRSATSPSTPSAVTSPPQPVEASPGEALRAQLFPARRALTPETMTPFARAVAAEQGIDAAAWCARHNQIHRLG